MLSLDEKIYYGIDGCGIFLSLVLSIVALHQLHKKRAACPQEAGPGRALHIGRADRLSDELLVTLASLHVVVYTTLGLLLPWLYLYPTADLFLCMRRPLFNDILSRQEFSTEWIITFVSVVFLIPVLMTLILWHVVMAFSLFRLLGRKESPGVIQLSLHPRAFAVCVASALLGLLINLLSSFWPHARLKHLHNIMAAFFFVAIFVLVILCYGVTLAVFAKPGPRPPKSIRVVRDRLLVLTTYLVGYMALWTVRSLGGLVGWHWPRLNMLAGVFTSFQGCFDMLVLTGLCRGCRSHEKPSPVGPRGRQIQDSRIRLGHSVSNRAGIRHFSNLYSTTEVGRPVNTRSAAERSIIFQMVSVWLDVPLAGYMSKRQVLKTVFWCLVGQSSQMINEKGREEYHWYAGFAEEGEECKDMRKEEKPQDSCDQTDTRMPSRAHCKCDEEVSGRAEWEERPVVPVYCEVVIHPAQQNKREGEERGDTGV